jgi:hypothetical protein
MLSHSCNDPYTHRTLCIACEAEGYEAAQAQYHEMWLAERAAVEAEAEEPVF